MCCLFLILVFLGPRFVDAIWWIAEPQRWQRTFNDQMIWPLLGLIFLPWTLLMYVLVWYPDGDITAFEWLLIILAVVCDIASWTGNGYKGYENRENIPYYPGAGSDSSSSSSTTSSVTSAPATTIPPTTSTPSSSSTPSTPSTPPSDSTPPSAS